MTGRRSPHALSCVRVLQARLQAFPESARRLRPPGATFRLTKAISCARPAPLVCLAFPTSTSQPAVLSLSRLPTVRLFSDLEVHPTPPALAVTKFRPGSLASVASARGRYLCAQFLTTANHRFRLDLTCFYWRLLRRSSHRVIASAPYFSHREASS